MVFHCRNLKKAGFETFWEVLQYYPKEYICYQTHLQHSRHVLVQGTVAKSYAGGPNFNMEVWVDPMHNPLLAAPVSHPSQTLTDDPSLTPWLVSSSWSPRFK